MQNPIQKIRQSSIVFEKLGILPENLKTLTSSNYPTVQYFLLKLRKRFYSPMSTKGCAGSWSTLKFSIFQTKKPGFLEIIDLYLNLGIGFCIT